MALSLAELEALDNKPPITEIKPGDGNPPPEDLAEKARLQAEADQKKADDEKAKLEAEKATPNKTQAQIDEEARIAAGGKPTVGPNGRPLKEDGTEEPEKPLDPPADELEGTFWDDVDKLRGTKLDIDWDKQLDTTGKPIDPESPQGALIRERMIEQAARDNFELYIQQTDPRGYQYLLHRQTGGTDEQFFAQKTLTLPVYEEFKNSVDLQVSVYQRSLLNAGIPEKQAKMLTDQAVKDKEIFELADTAYKAQDAAEKKSIADLQSKLANDEKVLGQRVQQLSKALSDEITTGTGMKMVIPDAKRAGFKAYVEQFIEQDPEGNFVLVQKLDPRQLGEQLGALYLQYVKGNLSEIVQREAQTVTTKRLKRAVENTRDPLRTGSEPVNKKKTLGEL